MFAFVIFAFVKSEFERFALDKLALTNDEPDASIRVNVLPDKFALLNIELLMVDPERSVPVNMADVKFVPFIVALLIFAPDKSVDVIFEPVIVVPFKLALLRRPDTKVVFVMVVLVRDAFDNSDNVMFALEMFEPLKIALLRRPDVKFVSIIVVLARDAPLKSTFVKLSVFVKVAPSSVFDAAVTVIVAVMLGGASYNVPCAWDATIVAKPGDNKVTKPDVGCIVNTVDNGSWRAYVTAPSLALDAVTENGATVTLRVIDDRPVNVV